MLCDFHFNKEMSVSICMHVQTCLCMVDVELWVQESCYTMRGLWMSACCSLLHNAHRDWVECVMHAAFLFVSYVVCCLLIWVYNGLKVVYEWECLTCLKGRIFCYILTCKFYGCLRNYQISNSGNRGERSTRLGNGGNCLSLWRASHMCLYPEKSGQQWYEW